jgi:hypothetical protein
MAGDREHDLYVNPCQIKEQSLPLAELSGIPELWNGVTVVAADSPSQDAAYHLPEPLEKRCDLRKRSAVFI